MHMQQTKQEVFETKWKLRKISEGKPMKPAESQDNQEGADPEDEGDEDRY